MGPFRENAFYLLAWRAFLVALIALALIVTRSFELAAAFLIGANVALLFSLGLIVWSTVDRTAHRVDRIVADVEAEPTAGWPSRPQVGTQLPQRRGIALRPGRIGFGDCLVCIGAHARDRVAAVATATEKG